MGNKQGTSQTTSISSVDADSPVFDYDNECKIEEMKNLIRNIRIVLSRMKEEIASSPMVPAFLFQSLFKDLEYLNTVLNPQRIHVCYIVGSTGVGKSSLIYHIMKENICQVSYTAMAGTRNFELIHAPGVNTIFVDTVGFGSDLNDSTLVRRFQMELHTDNHPDSMLIVVTQEQLRNVASLKTTTDYVNRVVKHLESIRHSTSVPIICVLNKIDQYFPDGLSNSEDCTKKIEEDMQEALTTVNKYLKTKATQCVATSAIKDYGIDELRSSINAQSPLNAQIIGNDLDYVKKHRWVIANKIIATFSAASAAASFLPIADIVIVTILQEWMYKMLACFSIDQNRTPDTFKSVHRALQSTSLIIRTGAFILGGIFQLSLIGYLIGSGVCVVAAASSTASVGWACYKYFTDGTSSDSCQTIIIKGMYSIDQYLMMNAQYILFSDENFLRSVIDNFSAL